MALQLTDDEEEIYLVWLARWGKTASLGVARGTSISSMGPGPDIGDLVSHYIQRQSLADGMLPAYLYYGQAGLLDPKLPVEAYGYGGAVGFTGVLRGVVGVAVAATIGFALGGAVGVAVDPAHRWTGGYDETADYQETERMYREADWGRWKRGSPRLN